MTDMMNIAVICGSLRKASFNLVVARALPGLASSGISFLLLEGMDEMPHYNTDDQTKGYPPKVLEWAQIIQSSDGLVFVTPEYNYSIPGVMKNALDWLSRLSPAPFAGKPVAIQTASIGMLGGTRARYHLRQVLLYLDAFVLNKPEIMIADVATKISAQYGLTDAKTRGLLGEQLVALAALIQRTGTPQ